MPRADRAGAPATKQSLTWADTSTYKDFLIVSVSWTPAALDDNVHPQNAMQFAFELQKAGNPFQMMIYPKSSHGVSDPQLEPHMRRLMLDFTVKNLLR